MNVTVTFGQEPRSWARRLGVSERAVELLLASDVVDLHVDTFIWTRVVGYDVHKRHGPGPLRGWFLGQADLPRLVRAGVTGAVWVVTTNPLRRRGTRTTTLLENLDTLGTLLTSRPRVARVVRSASDYRRARVDGVHGAFIGIQGGNAFDTPADVARVPEKLVVRVTLVHLSNSQYGATSSPLRFGDDPGLSDAGRDLVQELNRHRILVDLAHISRRGFYDALEVHDRSLPPIVTHTGVSGVRDHWRNLTDDQIRRIADAGGTVGVMYQSNFLGPKIRGPSSWIVDHLEHIVSLVGDDHASLGSDWDGAIVPPADMPTCLELPRIVQHMIDRGFAESTIQKILGHNFLRVVADVRG